MTKSPGKQMFYVHVPSCGGTSLWSILRSVYGQDQVLRVMGEDRSALNDTVDPEEAARYAACPVVGGHIRAPVARRLFPQRAAVTMLRHPVDLAISVYYRFVRNGRWTPDPAEGPADILRRYPEQRLYVIGEHCGPDFRDKTSTAADVKAFMQDNFSVIGITEEFDRSLFLMAANLGWSAVPVYDRRNVGGNRSPDLPPEVLAELSQRLALEIEIYDHARDLFEQACQQALPADIDARLKTYRRQLAWRARLNRIRNLGRTPYVKRAKSPD